MVHNEIKINPFVAVWMLAYNHEKYIRNAIESVLMQLTSFTVRLFIGEDCSTDRTKEICLEYKNSNPEKIQLLLNVKNNIHINGQNTYRACFNSGAKYIAILEGDDYWTDPYKLQKQVEFLEANPDYVICYHNSIVVDENNNIINESRLPERNKRDYSAEELIKAYKIQPQTMCFRNVIRDFPDEFFRSFGGDKFLTSLLGAYGKGKYLGDIKPSAFRVHQGGINAGEKDLYRKYKNHLSTRIALYQYYERIGKKVYSDHFLLNEIFPAIKKIMELKTNDVPVKLSVPKKKEEPDLIREYYSGENVLNYEERRKENPKWQFENDALNYVLKELSSEINDIIDAPVGTGRFLNSYQLLGDMVKIFGIDYSSDMLKAASEKAGTQNISFIEQDIINNKLKIAADLTVCYRFLNLINWQEAVKTIGNLLSVTKKYSLLAIRLVDDNYTGDVFIENKIYLHKRNEVDRLIKENGFEVLKRFEHNDKRAGQYTILLCGKVNANILNCRVNKNFRFVYTYGQNEPEGKIYQVKDNTHAKFIEQVSCNPDLKEFFPKIYKISNEFIDTEWVKGDLVESSEWINVIGILADIHNLQNDKESSFDYVNDLVLPRFSLALPVTGKDIYKQTLYKIEEGSSRYHKKVSHPDLIPGNVIRTPSGYKLIDNELMCYSIYHRIDLLNLLNNLKPADRMAVFFRFIEISGLSLEIFKDEIGFLQALWLARQVGSFLVKEKIQPALALIKDYKNNENILPVDLYKMLKIRVA